MGKETNSSLDNFTEQTIFDFLLLPYFLHTAPQNLFWCEIFNISLQIKLSVFSIKDLYIQTNLRNKFLTNLYKTILTSTQTSHNIHTISIT